MQETAAFCRNTMNQHIENLYALAQKPSRLIIGLMSGTSMDGLDVALCNIEGAGTNTNLSVLQFETVPFTDNIKKEIRDVFSKKNVDLEKLTLLNPWIALQHARMVNNCLKKWKLAAEDIDLIASHGQTIYHAPKTLHGRPKFGNATLQIGDGDHLAVATGIITISDFRQKHIAAGGEGAPLAVYGDYILFGKKGENRILLNIGGIANFTYLPADMDTAKIFSTDTGPGNTMMDAFMRKHFNRRYDKQGAVAASGKINDKLLAALKKNAFFKRPFPKTTGPELFSLDYLAKAQSVSGTNRIAKKDVMATLNKFSADSICDAVNRTVRRDEQVTIYTSGGGIHNPVLQQHIIDQLPDCRFASTAELEINPDAKEAVLFALLANECVSGDVSTWGKGAKGMPAVSMGKISFPG